MPEKMPESQSPAGAVGRVAGMILRGRWTVLLVAAAVFLGTVAVLYQLPDRFTSEATLLVVPQQIPSRYVTPTTETNISDALQAMTKDVLASSRLRELIEEFGLYRKERQHLAPEEVIALMRAQIDIQPADPAPGRREISSFKISFAAERAALAQEVTSKLTSFFIEANLKTREDQAANTTSFLQEQLNGAKTNLAAQEERVRDFKTQYLGELPEQQQGNLAILSGAQLQLQNIAASLDRAEQQRVYLESMIAGYRRMASKGMPVPGVSGEASRPVNPLRAAQAELARLQNERTKLLITYRPTYPDVVNNARDIAAAQATIRTLTAAPAAPPDASATHEAPAAPAMPEIAEEDTAVAQLNSQLEANRLEIENLHKDEVRQKEVVAQYQARLNQTPVREQQLAGILRDYELSKQDYTDLLGKEQQSQLAMSLEKQQGGQQFRLVEPPSLPALPSSPKRVKVSLMALGAGFALGLAAALAREFLRPSFHDSAELTQHFGAPLVIAVPNIVTRRDRRRRGWTRLLETCGGVLVASAISAAEFYVLRHP